MRSSVAGRVFDTVVAENVIKDSVVQQCQDQYYQNVKYNGTFPEDRAKLLETVMPYIQKAVFFTAVDKFFM